MSVFKCKMCGGTIEFEPGATVGICDSCGTKQTLPRLDDDRRANLYDRANHFRRNNEFDKAMGIYEQILNEDSTDAEAYWSLVLCRYGIEYVEDPGTHRRVPTVNRAQFTSIFDDDNYRAAMRYADPAQQALYYEEAQVINEIQKGILQISQKEEPFDVFICYKETDAGGRRTPDSVLANDLYHQLTQEGFKVFFSRITLENKLGTAYEPYIFAALNSARVMVVLGTRPEYFSAVWVKNEWARFLALIKNGAQKTLIPAYKDMDPYDLPDEFSHLQALDMSKLGFMQDLIRGIKKISGKDQPKPVYQQGAAPVGSAAASSLLRRAFMFLEDGNWQEADQYCEKVLDMEPENAGAYLGKLMAELQVKTPDALGEQAQPFDDRNNYQKALRFADSGMRTQLMGYNTRIRERLEYERVSGIYQNAAAHLDSAGTYQTGKDFTRARRLYLAAAEAFQSISGFQDADTLAENCRNAAEICRLDAIYADALSKMTGEDIQNYEAAIRIFQQIPGWRDSYDRVGLCMRKIEEIRARQEAERLERERKAEEARLAAEKAGELAKQRRRILALCFAVLFFLGVLWVTVIRPKMRENALIGKYGSEAVSRYGVGFFDENSERIIDKYGMESVEKYGLDFFDKYGEDFIDKYGISFFDKYGQEFVDKHGKDLISQFSSDFFASNDVESTEWELKYRKGAVISFGAYEQDNNSANGKEPVEWLILEKDGSRILAVSMYALDCKPFNTEWKSVTWETSSLRQWLNSDFLNTAFTADQRNAILKSAVPAEKNPNYSTDPGKDTADQIFLLSISEAQRYFSSDQERQAKPTAYAKANGAYTGSSGYTWWWLRSPGDYGSNAPGVDPGGSFVFNGNHVSHIDDAVRPALWINLDSDLF